MAWSVKPPEPVSVEPKLRLQALRAQSTRLLLAIYSLLPPELRNTTVVSEKPTERSTPINQDEHEMRIKRTLKTIRVLDLANVLGNFHNLASASGANREHQATRRNQTTHQIPQAGAEVMSAANQISHHQRSHKAAEISDCIDQPDRCGGSGLTQKKRRYSPKTRLKAIKRSPHKNEQANGYQGPRAIEHSEREGESAQKDRDGRMPPSLSSSIGMPAIQLLSDESSDVWQSSQQGHL